jgi:hypothetical protein
VFRTSLRVGIIIAFLAVSAVCRAGDGPAAAFESLRSLATLLMSERRERTAEALVVISIASEREIVVKRPQAAARTGAVFG